MKHEYDIARNTDWHRRGKIFDDMLAFLHAWWTTNPVSWDSEFFTLPPVHADLRPVQADGPPIWTGGASEAAMRRVRRSGGRLARGRRASARRVDQQSGRGRRPPVVDRAPSVGGRRPRSRRT
jgi:alkanesulfonate monooxygenase SsuD/methylene tetrahydromethanopterin reductase-like flavin-dependent oxidoreductase (luciferase family)